ncbi:MAG: DMT family transporter [Alphaproteobacteria bacterium]|nr:DMT family transporter [Rhodospirillales bacterium]MCW9045638.1 DMT family transporter [Alphaproteobacteria bacterium]
MTHSPNRIALIALIIGALAIALAPIFVRLSEAGPVATAFYRILFSLPVLTLWMWRENVVDGPYRKPSSFRDYWRLSIAGFFFAGDLAVWHWSIKLTSVANATLLANFAPLFVALIGFLFFKERFSKTFLSGLALAIIGACALMGDSLVFNEERLGGDILGVVTAMFYAGYILSVASLRSQFSTATIMTWSGVVTAAVLLPVALLSGESLIITSLYGWGVVIALAVVSHAGGQSLIAYALAHLPASFSSIGLLIQPAAAAVLAWIIFNEAIGPLQAFGGVIILLGIYLAKRGSR